VKNKKLFAILTLICFALTMMPVAAFAADKVYASVNEDSEIVSVGDDIVMDITGATSGSFYVFAMKDGKVNKAYGIQVVDVADGQIVLEEGMAAAGTYDIYVVDQNTFTDGIYDKYQEVAYTRDEAAKKLIDESNVIMTDKTVTVKASKNEYKVSFVTKDGEEITEVTALKANSGYDVETVYVLVTDKDDNAVVGANVTVSTNSSAISVDAESVKTNAAGMAKVKISASIAGEFKVYAEYGTKADATLVVKAGAMTASQITVVQEQKAPVALDSEVGPRTVQIRFAVSDANGNAATPVDYKVKVDAPKASKISGDNLTLVQTPAGWALMGDTLDEEGTYTFKVILSNGNYATATVTVKEFQTPVKLVVTYPTNAVELDGVISPLAIKFVDANGVTKDATGVDLSANGYAVKDFDANTGKVTVKADEKYVGSKITVLAVSTKYNLVASTELTVAKAASAVKYATTTADIAVNNTLVANIVDEDGNKVALNGAVGTPEITYVVVSKPENAKVAVSTKAINDLNTKGEFKVSFTASAIGEYKIQTIVRYEQGKDQVVKYYSGVDTITVGNTGIKDVVVMSIGSNEIVINAAKSNIDAAPIVANSRTFVPFRALAEAFGANVAYDEATQSVTASLNGTTVVMTIGSATYTVNGVAKTADVAPFISGSRTYVPVRFAAEAFGIKVTPTYDEKGATADVIFAK